MAHETACDVQVFPGGSGPMRRYPWFVIAAGLGISILATKSPAQQPPNSREAAALRAIRRANTNAQQYERIDRTSAHRPYSNDEEPGPIGLPYARDPSPVPQRPAPRPNFYSQRQHNYYAGMLPGQHPNANAVNTHTLCVPGRRAMLTR